MNLTPQRNTIKHICLPILGGILLLPVTVGVRHGDVRGRISVEPDKDGCVVRFTVD